MTQYREHLRLSAYHQHEIIENLEAEICWCNLEIEANTYRKTARRNIEWLTECDEV